MPEEETECEATNLNHLPKAMIILDRHMSQLWHRDKKVHQQRFDQSLDPTLSFRTTTARFRQRLDDHVPPNPLWLRTGFLVLTLLLFGALVSALLLLLFLSRKEDGLALLTTNHFSWTYGPTAVLIFIVAIWRQIDFHCKALTPWSELRQGNAQASKSILLDYISPLQVVSFYTALRNKHIAVVASISGFFCLKLITLASTGLLFPATASLPSQAINLTVQTSFNGSLYDSSTNPALFDPSLAYTAYAVMVKGLPYPEGTTENMVYNTVALPQNVSSRNASITVHVEALIPQFQCQSAPVTINLQPANVTDFHPEDRIVLQFPECSLRNSGVGTPAYALNPHVSVCPQRQLSPLVQQIDCFNQSSSNDTDNWQLLTMADFRYQQTLANSTSLTLGDAASASSWSTSVEQVTGIACKAGYSLEQIQVVYDLSHNPPSILTNRLGRKCNNSLGGFSGPDLGLLTTSALKAASDMFGNLKDNDAALEYPNTLFKIMAAISGGSYESLLNETTMTGAAEKVFNQVAIQSVAKYLVGGNGPSLMGSLVENRQRLHVNEIALWSMLSGCFAMGAITILLLFKRPKGVSEYHLDHGTTTALLLAHSNDFGNLLRQLGQAKPEEEFRPLRFSADLQQCPGQDSVPVISVSESGPSESQNSDKDKVATSAPMEWWSPLTIKRWVLGVTLSLPILAIGLLEMLQQLSDRNQGFVAVSNLSDTVVTIYTRIVPGLVMLLIATLINSLDFNIVLLAPFNALWSADPKHTRRGIPGSILGLPAPFATWKACQNRFVAASLSGPAALIGSILSVVVSGLYTIENVPLAQTLPLNRSDQFNTSWTTSAVADNSAAVASSLTESLGLDYPKFTYNEIALATITPISSNEDLGLDAMLLIQVPALRADLECTALTPRTLNVSAAYNPRIETANAFMSATVPLPASCMFGGSDGNSSTIDFSYTFTLPGNASLVGRLLDLHVGPFDPVSASSSDEISPTTQPDNPPGCPSLAFIYGHADANDASHTNITALSCYQYMDELHANVSFTWPELAIMTSHPLIVDESSSKRILSGPNEETAFPFRLQLHMDDEFASFNQTLKNTTTTAGGSLSLDNFFQGVLFGQQPLDPALLAGDEADRSRVFEGIRGFYRRYMAQAISSNMRVPLAVGDKQTLPTALLPSGTVTGTLCSARVEPRVMQNPTAKLVLQIQLSIMLVLASLAIHFSKLHNILPFNPCCICGVAALFAWSRMSDPDDPLGREIMHGGCREVHDCRWRFRLGWWDITIAAEGHPTRWYGIDAVKASEDG
ncbi:hypothetical protein ABEF95_007855 [Exophiala dermatitidis]